MAPSYSRTGANRLASTGTRRAFGNCHPIPAQPCELQLHCRAHELKCKALGRDGWCGHFGIALTVDNETQAPIRLERCVELEPFVDGTQLRSKREKYRVVVPESSIFGNHCRAQRLVCQHLLTVGRRFKCDWHGDAITSDPNNNEPLKCADCLLEGAPMKTEEVTNE